jgi:hypothetical protein
MPDGGNRYIGIVQLKADSTRERMVKDIPQIVEFFKAISRGECEQAFRSNDGLLFAYFIKSNLPGAMLQAEFEKCAGTLNGDSFLAFEAGELAAGIGFTRAWTWLQRH